MTAGGPDRLVIDDWDEAEALCWIVSKHARKVRDAMDMDEHADNISEVSGKAREALAGDRDDLEVVYDDETKLEILYEATEYTVEDGPGNEITEDDVGIARRVYERLGGEVDIDSEAFAEDVAKAVENAGGEE